MHVCLVRVLFSVRPCIRFAGCTDVVPSAVWHVPGGGYATLSRGDSASRRHVLQCCRLALLLLAPGSGAPSLRATRHDAAVPHSPRSADTHSHSFYSLHGPLAFLSKAGSGCSG